MTKGQSGDVRWDQRILAPGQETRVGQNISTGETVIERDQNQYTGRTVSRRGNRYFTDEKLWERHIEAENSGQFDLALPALPTTQGLSDHLRDANEQTGYEERQARSGRRVFSVPELPWKRRGA